MFVPSSSEQCRPYPSYTKHPCSVLVTNAIVIRETEDSRGHEVLLCTRGKDPFKGSLAFPGGHVEPNEAPDVACLRELKEETDLTGSSLELLTIREDAFRDPRKHMVVFCLFG